MSADAFHQCALDLEAAQAEIERMHGVFRMISADDARELERYADRLDRLGLESGDRDHALQDALRAIATQSRASWAR